MMPDTPPAKPATPTIEPPSPRGDGPPPKPDLPKEVGGAKGPEPTRYGDWQHKGRVTDF